MTPFYETFESWIPRLPLQRCRHHHFILSRNDFGTFGFKAASLVCFHACHAAHTGRFCARTFNDIQLFFSHSACLLGALLGPLRLLLRQRWRVRLCFFFYLGHEDKGGSIGYEWTLLLWDYFTLLCTTMIGSWSFCCFY